VEQLEDRRLLSVALLPGVLNVKTLDAGSHAVLTVQILADTTAGANLLKAPRSALVVSVLDAQGHVTALGQPVATHAEGGGLTGLLLKFKRSALHGLGAGTYTLQVSDGTAADTETATFAIFSPGSGGHGHDSPTHPPGPPSVVTANSLGLQTAAGHNASSQAGQHSPVFQALAGAGGAVTTPTLPAAAAAGIATAKAHNGSSQAGNHSPVFEHS
jgi:hypothetical protein